MCREKREVGEGRVEKEIAVTAKRKQCSEMDARGIGQPASQPSRQTDVLKGR